MRFIVCRNRGPGSWFIRLATRSDWSHVAAIIDQTETCISAEPFKGVVERPLAEIIAESSDHEIIDILTPNYDAAVNRGLSHVGKGYDWSGLVGTLTGDRNWQDPEKWFCSESGEDILIGGDNNRWRDEHRHRVTPQDFYGAKRT